LPAANTASLPLICGGLYVNAHAPEKQEESVELNVIVRLRNVCRRSWPPTLALLRASNLVVLGVVAGSVVLAVLAWLVQRQSGRPAAATDVA
jgi:hypothetical protein